MKRDYEVVEQVRINLSSKNKVTPSVFTVREVEIKGVFRGRDRLDKISLVRIWRSAKGGIMLIGFHQHRYDMASRFLLSFFVFKTFCSSKGNKIKYIKITF